MISDRGLSMRTRVEAAAISSWRPFTPGGKRLTRSMLESATNKASAKTISTPMRSLHSSRRCLPSCMHFRSGPRWVSYLLPTNGAWRHELPAGLTARSGGGRERPVGRDLRHQTGLAMALGLGEHRVLAAGRSLHLAGLARGLHP